MKSFVKKDLLSKKRGAALKKNLKKKKEIQNKFKVEECQYYQINGSKKMLKQEV